MPISRCVHHGVLYTTLTGFISFEDIRAHVNESRQSHTFECPELVDAREAEPALLSLNDIVRAAFLLRDSLGDQTPGRRAIIVNRADNLRLARIFAGLVKRWFRIAVFEDPESAESWHP